jgi:2-keto-4-pentenoate hydratase/2-oxohepta-3-ene-1,7-dioic acid hydratase in catechol pathway
MLATTPDSTPGVRYGVVDGGSVFETAGRFSDDHTGASFNLAKVRLLPPAWPTKIVCVGRNYADHAKELGNEPPKEPIIFLKPHSSLLAHQDKIIYPPISKHVSYEGELGVVIGRQAKNVAARQADQYVFGFTCVNDVTARDLQKSDPMWTRAKGFDTFCPVGPWIVPKDELNLADARVRTYVNGEQKQDGLVSDMIFSINDIIEFVSAFMTLEPGDIIATGTPPGVGPMEAGSEVEVLIEGIGTLKNKLAAAA